MNELIENRNEKLCLRLLISALIRITAGFRLVTGNLYQGDIKMINNIKLSIRKTTFIAFLYANIATFATASSCTTSSNKYPPICCDSTRQTILYLHPISPSRSDIMENMARDQKEKGLAHVPVRLFSSPKAASVARSLLQFNFQ